MRKVARYAFSAPSASIPDVETAWLQIQDGINNWIDSKGRRDEQDGAVRIEYLDGRVADLRTVDMTAGGGKMLSWALQEPSFGGVFRTTIHLARDSGIFAIACELEAGAPAQVVAPVSFDAHCPKILRDVIDLEVPWSAGEVPLSTSPRRFDGAASGADLAALISSESRNLPLVVISEYEQFVLHPGIAKGIARDLAGLALVAVATDSASWGVTHTLGTDWSCYNGAIRLKPPPIELTG
jgi:hypothetical protein